MSIPIKCERLLNPTHAELVQIRDIYTANFPANERKPFERLISCIASGSYICLVARPAGKPEEVVAFAFLAPLPGTEIVFLEYIAVAKNAHGLGIGTELFNELATRRWGTKIVWEVEPPTDDSASPNNKRIRFYERLGAKLIALSTVYAMPDFELAQGSVPLRLMQLPLEQQPDKDELTSIIRGIYTVAYPGNFELRDKILMRLDEVQDFSSRHPISS